MKDLKARNNILRVFFFATLLLSLAAVASAQDRDDIHTCSNATVAGHWGYSETGTLYVSGVAVPYASVGTFTLDADGNYAGERTASLGGKIVKATFKGTATVNSDCTGTLTISFYDQSGNVTSTATKFLVFVDHSREARAIATSVEQVVSSGTVSIPAVLTTNAKKLSPARANEQ
jgi:hypothetical protein